MEGVLVRQRNGWQVLKGVRVETAWSRVSSPQDVGVGECPAGKTTMALWCALVVDRCNRRAAMIAIKPLCVKNIQHGRSVWL